MADHHDELKKLHTRLIDSHDGYKESRDRVKSGPFVQFFDRMIQQRSQYAGQIRAQLAREGVELDDDGSILAAAHRTWLALRDAVTGDDSAVYAEIVNGERALKEMYDDAIKATAGKAEWAFLMSQRSSVETAIAEAERARERHAA